MALEMNSALLVLFALGISAVHGQRVAPGVNPQHYQPPQQYQQQPPQHQQHYQQPQQNLPPGHQQQINQQQQMQYQQPPVQQHPPVQQAPVQQAPVQQVPVQQAPQGHGGHHAPHGHHGQQQVLNAANIQHEREHIQEHMQVPIDTSKMSEAELQFHYFKMHDSDNNNKLDGCELIKSLIHWHVKDEITKEGNAEDKVGSIYTDEKLSEIIDYVLKTMDSNNDGYVDYTEYRESEENSAMDNKQ